MESEQREQTKRKATHSSDVPNQYDEQNGNATVLDELINKYLCDEECTSVWITSITGTSPCKLANQRALELVVLDHRSIDRIGDIHRFTPLIGSVTEIDLSWNNISSWKEIVTLLSSIPTLRVFNASHNPLSRNFDVDLPKIDRLFNLILNSTNLPLSVIRQVVSSMPSLNELHLSQNRSIESDLDSIDQLVSDSVSILYLNECEISKWSTAVTFCRLFPSCDHLFLCENPIKTIDFYSESDLAYMRNIQSLYLSKCHINDWKSIEQLNDMRSLKDLKINQNPLLSKYSAEERHHLVVGRLQRLQILNGSTVSSEQREASERFLVRYYDIREDKPSIFSELIARHGKVEQLCTVDLSPKTHASIVAFCEEIGYRGNIVVNLSQSVSTLMRTFERVTNIAAHRMRIFYMSIRGDPHPCELRLPNQKLFSLRVEDGDHFYVQSKLMSGRKRTSQMKVELPYPFVVVD
ncbi:hypothetical protein AB6A40_007631 [Gnathostoma spinigerum]|uniref:Tubulin-specific chaperone cofactor E-like protein n=1 Tax=Gnathostoma spinigerum TaxID=75299 RepID=A0ABD6EP02_9BILA